MSPIQVAVLVFVMMGLYGEATPAPVDLPEMIGSYQLVSEPADPDYNSYLEKLGVVKEFREVMIRIPINLEIAKAAGGSYKYKIVTPLLTRETEFQFDNEMNDTYVDGRKYKNKFTKKGDTVVQTLKFEGGPTATSVYKFTPSSMIATLKAQDKVVVRHYRRIQDVPSTPLPLL